MSGGVRVLLMILEPGVPLALASACSEECLERAWSWSYWRGSYQAGLNSCREGGGGGGGVILMELQCCRKFP